MLYVHFIKDQQQGVCPIIIHRLQLHLHAIEKVDGGCSMASSRGLSAEFGNILRMYLHENKI